MGQPLDLAVVEVNTAVRTLRVTNERRKVLAAKAEGKLALRAIKPATLVIPAGSSIPRMLLPPRLTRAHASPSPPVL